MITIIIPAYNAAATLSRCLDSIIAQSFTDWEAMVVDDGSADSTPAICDEYAAKDSRIRVMHKQNGGVSAARNAALEVAAGQFVAFVDSDDWAGPDYLKNMLETMDEGVDLVVAGATLHQGDAVIERQCPAVAAGGGDFDALFDGTSLARRTGPWGKLYKMDIVKKNGLRFPEDIHMGEDACFLYEYMLHSDSVKLISSADYHYYVAVEGSLTKKVNPFASELKAYRTIGSLMRRLKAEKSVRSAGSVAALERSLVDYQRRALNAAYADESLSAEDRLAYLRGEDWRLYASLYCDDGLRGKLKGALLNLGWLKLYDLVRRLPRRNAIDFSKS